MILKFKREILIFTVCGAITLGLVLSVIFNPTVLAFGDSNGHFSIIMYHHITEDKSKIGDYVISKEQLESDFKYLKEKGYNTLSVRELCAIDRGEMKLPNKSIVITFDDGQESLYKYAFPLLKRYNFKAVLSIIGIYTEKYSEIENKNIAYSHITFDEINEMVSSGLVEIGNHSYNMHFSGGTNRMGVSKLKGESYENYSKAITEDIEKFNKVFYEKLGFNTKIYTYPFGKFSKETEKIIKQNGFVAAFTCYEGKIVPKSNEDWLYNLGRYNRFGKYTTYNFFKKVLG